MKNEYYIISMTNRLPHMWPRYGGYTMYVCSNLVGMNVPFTTTRPSHHPSAVVFLMNCCACSLGGGTIDRL